MNISELTPTSILSEEVLSEVFDKESEIDRTYLLLDLEEKAKVLGVKSKFDTVLKAYKAEFKRLQKENEKPVSISQANVLNYDFDEPMHELRCGSWIADMDGIRQITPFGESMVCYNPLYISRKFTNIDTGKEKIEITYYKKYGDSGEWNSIILDKNIISSNTKLVQLSDYGLSVTTENAKQLVRFLTDIENLNADVIPFKKSISRLGWVENKFMPYETDIEFDAKDHFKDLYESISTSGSKEKWFDLVRDLRFMDRYEPRLYLAGAFASVLLKPLNMLPFILNLWGETGGGKTVSIMVACSVWANPSENMYISDPSTTQVALERRLNTLNNFPLIVDDLSKTRDKLQDGFTDLVYLLCSGKGKERSNLKLGLEQNSTWNNVTLTNMERPLAVETMKGGAINRILDFEMEDGDIYTPQRGTEVAGLVKNNFGFAGEMFIEALETIGFDEVRRIQEEFLTKIKEVAPDKEGKQMAPLSVLLTADKIATEHIFKDGCYLDFDKCIEQLKSRDEVSDNKRGYEFLMSEISMNINNFKTEFDEEPRGQIWGLFENIRGEDFCLLHTNKFKELCSKGNISPKAFLHWAYKNNILATNNGHSKKSLQYRKRTDGIIATFYALKMEEEASGEGFKQIKEGECPFA